LKKNKNRTFQPIPYPENNPSNISAAIVLLVGSAENYRSDFKRGIINLEKQFNSMHHFPIVAFHFNMREDEMESVRKSIKSDIEFVLITKPRADESVSPINPTKIMEMNQAAYSFPLEYRFQSYFFFDTLFNHPKVQKYNYIMRIDNDIDILVPINYNPFHFMETQGKVFGIRHWSMDPLEICTGLYGPTELYQKQVYQWIDGARDRQIPPKCYCGGGATFFAYAPFFRSPQIQSYWQFIQCLGGIWTNRWAEQNIFPIAVSLIADNPEKRWHVFTNVAVNHRGGLLQPHILWGIPTWPYHPTDQVDKTVTAHFEPIYFKRGCFVYFANKGDIPLLRRSLTNLEHHFFRLYQYPVYIFHQDLSDKDYKLISSAVNERYTELKFIKIDSSITRTGFYLKNMFEQDSLMEYGFFIRMDPGTMLLADLFWDPFKLMEQQRFVFAYHRWHSPMTALEPIPDDNLWKITEEVGKEMGSPFNKRILPPLGFSYSLHYFVVGNFNFFRKNEYKVLASKMPDTSSTSQVWPLAVALLDDEPWRMIGDMTNINMNWATSDPTPFAAPSWWEQTPIPTWPYRYSNRNPPCQPE